MSPDRRTAVLAAGALAALTALALSGCAPVGTDGNAYGDSPASQNKPAAAQAPEAEPAAAPEQAPPKPKVKLTTALTGVTVARMGKVVKDQNGWILYRFDKDKAKPTPVTNCYGDCAKLWPPALTDGNTTVEGINEDLVGSVTRKDGTKQLTIGGWPIYRYGPDKKKADGTSTWKGQGVGYLWFVVAPDGGKNLTCLPKTPPKPAQPPADNGGGDDNGGGGDGYSY